MKLKHTWIWIVPAVAIVSGILLADSDDEAKVATGTETPAAKADAAQISLARDAIGQRVFKLSNEVLKRIDLETAKVDAGQVQPTVTAYGQLIEDPGSTFTLRSPITGFLESDKGSKWPLMGDRVDAGAALGRILPRLSPVERFDLTSRLMQANADVEAFTARLAAARSSYENKKSLNRQQKVVTDRALESALANVKSEEARLAAAQQTVQLLTDALAANGAANDGVKLAAQRSGEVIQMNVQPGEAIDSGQVLMKFLDTRHQLASVAIPMGTVVDANPTGARVHVVGQESGGYAATVRSAVPSFSSTMMGQSFLIDFDSAGAPLRPGMNVQADLALPGPPREGVIVPRSAIVRFGGSAYVYKQTADNEFTRVQIETDTPVEAGWLDSSGLSAGDRVVVVGAGSLLSEELRSQIEAESEGDE